MTLIKHTGFCHWAAIATLAALLAACGGGGGGGSGPAAVPDPAPGFSVSIDRSELRFSGEEGGNIASQLVIGTGSGPTPPSTIYTGGQDLGSALDRVLVQVVGEQVRFTVYPKTQLAAGEYKGSLRLFACADEPCARHIKGSPVEVPYTVSIAKGFTTTPRVVQMEAVAGATATATNIGVSLPPGASSYTYSTGGYPWLKVSNVTSTGFTLGTIAKAPGVYQGAVSLYTGGKAAILQVTYAVKPDGSGLTVITPALKVLNMNVTTGLTSEKVTLGVAVPSWGNALTTSVRYFGTASGWLAVTPGAPGTLSVVAAATNLAAGNYGAELTLSAGGELFPVTVPVYVNVLPANWAIAGTSSLTVDGASKAADLGGALSIDIPNLPVQGWQASSNASWLKLSRSSGSTRTDQLGWTVDRAEMLKLANFTAHPAELTLSLASGKVAPLKYTVTLNKKLPELNFISPHTRLPGEAGTYIVRGRGFDSVADLEQALGAGAAAASKITRVNDTQFELAMAPAQQGEAVFSLSNALGANTGSVALKVVAQPALAYAATVTEGSKGGLVFDAERQALFTVNKTLGALMRFKRNGANWDASSVSVPGIDTVALSPDGASLVVTAAPGQVVLLDPATLVQQGSYKTMYIGSEPLNSLPRSVMRNDGKLLFAGFTGEGSGGGMPYFDVSTRSFGSIGGSYGFGWAVASGDGSHINIVQRADLSPQPPMVTLDGTDSVAKPSKVGLTFWYEAAQSLRGERFAEGTYTVWDRDFNIIGKVALPDQNYFGRTPLFSPDGTRLYVLAYSINDLNPSSTVMPRVYIFDSSTRMVTTTNLPLLGSFDLADYPTCHNGSYGCNTRALGAISPDGKTLFFVGDAKLVVAPVPATLGASRALMQRVVLPAKR
jgi:hypothetical protein